jgi:hypothetical protein
METVLVWQSEKYFSLKRWHFSISERQRNQPYEDTDGDPFRHMEHISRANYI